MDSKKKITVSWSGGKDSAFALYRILLREEYDVVNLHTVFGKETLRVGLHGIKEELIQRQAYSLNIPLVSRYLKESDSAVEYEKLIKKLYFQFRDEGITHILFGDIFLEDLRSYRMELLKDSGLIPVFPLWKANTDWLLDQFINEGFRTIICAANESCHNAGILGRTIDEHFRRILPPNVDSCGENGEYHSFVFDGPIFTEEVEVESGEEISQTYEYFVKDAEGKLTKHETKFYFVEVSPRTSLKNK